MKGENLSAQFQPDHSEMYKAAPLTVHWSSFYCGISSEVHYMHTWSTCYSCRWNIVRSAKDMKFNSQRSRARDLLVAYPVKSWGRLVSQAGFMRKGSKGPRRRTDPYCSIFRGIDTHQRHNSQLTGDTLRLRVPEVTLLKA